MGADWTRTDDLRLAKLNYAFQSVSLWCQVLHSRIARAIVLEVRRRAVIRLDLSEPLAAATRSDSVAVPPGRVGGVFRKLEES
jgi:hypothetical protein